MQDPEKPALPVEPPASPNHEIIRSSSDNNEKSAINREATVVITPLVGPKGTGDDQKEKKKKKDSVFGYYVVRQIHLSIPDRWPSIAISACQRI